MAATVTCRCLPLSVRYRSGPSFAPARAPTGAFGWEKNSRGKPLQKRFSSYAKAAQWVEEMQQDEREHGKAIFSLSYDQLAEARSAFERLSEHKVSLTAVVDHWIKFQAPLEVEKTFSEMEREFIASRKNIGCKERTLGLYRSYMKVICEESMFLLARLVRQPRVWSARSL
jgi:hypothetical protein